jgi:hypothetical protein
VDVVAYALPFVVFVAFYGLLRRRERQVARGDSAAGLAATPRAGSADGGASRWSPTHLRFVAAWAIGLAGMLLIDVSDGFGVLLLPSGLLLCWTGLALVRDRHEWDRFRLAAARQSRTASLADRAFVRGVFAAGFLIIGAGWTLGGALGALALVGEYTFP